MEMVLVPAGCFDMGEDGEGGRQCFDEPFWIDRYEVTNAQYGFIGSRCIEWSSQSDQPRDCVNWFDSRDFCASRGARLPTEAEWEYAARGPDGLIYPWGNDLVADNGVYGGNSGLQTAAVGSAPGGVSWVGAYDLSGNVWEWTSTIYQDYPYNARDGRENNSDINGPRVHRVVRGGSFDQIVNFLRATYRDSHYTDDVSANLGFRCARD